MILKLFGSALLLAVGMAVAYQNARREKQRLEVLDAWIALLRFLRNQIDCYLRPLEEILADEFKIRAHIATQLAEIKKKYGKPRQSQLIFAEDLPEVEDVENVVEKYPVRLVLTREGYFKKITFKSLEGSARAGKDEQKVKEGDAINQIIDADNADNLLFFTDKCQVYRAAVDDFENTKVSEMGDFLNAYLKMDKDERPIYMRVQNTYPAGENMIFIFENGKGVRVPISAYETKGNRKRLTGAYSAASPIAGILHEVEKEPVDLMLVSDAERAIVFKSSLIPVMSTRSAGGVTLMSLGRREKKVAQVRTDFGDDKGYRKYKLPAMGVPLNDKNAGATQLSLDGEI